MRLGILLCGAAVAKAQTPTPTPVDSNIAVTSYAQSHGQDLSGTPCTTRGGTGCGGCYPDGFPPTDPIQAALAMLPKVNPEWQAIGPMITGGDPALPPVAAPLRITGSIGLSKSPGDDFPGSHISADYNAEIIPDDNGRLATGNTTSRVEFEWEGDLFPMFAWAGEGDHVIAEGRWIFDCGHPDPGPLGKCSNNTSRDCIIDGDCTAPGTCTSPPPVFGYQSEMHPPQAAVMIRNKSLPAPHNGRTAPAIPATQADVYISANGGGAGDRCTVTHKASDGDVLFTKDCFKNHCSVTTTRSCKVDKDCAHGETCIVLDPAGRLATINASNFEFDMPLPPPPSSSATLQIKTKSFKPKGGLMPKAIFVTPAPPLGPAPTMHVIVPMAAPLPSGQMPNVFAQRIRAGWKEDTTSLKHVRVKFKSVTVNNPLKDSTPAMPHVCTNPIGGLTTTACTTDAGCAAGSCGTGNPCHVDKDCPKTDFCAAPSVCVGGIVPGWDLWAEVNGNWIKFKKLGTIGAKAPFAVPPYVQPSLTPLIIGEHFKFDEFVPPDGSIHIKATGHSLNCLTTLFANNLKDGLRKFGLGAGGACLAAGSRGSGKVEVTHNGPDFGTTTPGQPVTFMLTSAGGDGGVCSTTSNRLCVTDNDCPAGTCAVTTGACRANSDCKHCSGDASRFCTTNNDCTSPQTCVAGSETCNNAETCTATSGAYTLEYTVAIIP